MILVFGKTGQLAQAISRKEAVHLLGRKEADLTRPEDCAKAIEEFSPKAVINAAAFTDVNGAEADEDLATVINADAPAAMAATCARLGIPFVHVSTDYVFDGSGDLPRKADAKLNPLNAYGRSKAKGENAVRAAGGVFAILRTSWVYSAAGRNFLTTVVNLARTRREIDVIDDQIGGPTAASCLAGACLAAVDGLLKDSAKSGTYHFTGRPNVSWAAFAEAIVDAGSLPLRINTILSEQFNSVARRPLNSRLDNGGFTEIFQCDAADWQLDLDQVVQAAIDKEQV